MPNPPSPNCLISDPSGEVFEARALLLGKKSPELLKDVFVFWKNRDDLTPIGRFRGSLLGKST